MLFPKDFLWAGATSAYQFEGASNIDGKAPSVQDVKSRNKGDIEISMDHYHLYKEDIELLGEMGLKAYRFSMAWSRVYPNQKRNGKGITFYRNLIKECGKHGITPVIALYHDDMPCEIESKGGWKNRETIQYFAEYAQTVFEEFGQYEIYWQPICEQNVLVIEELLKQTDSLQSAFQQNHHMLLAQAKAVKIFHDKKCRGKIGPAPNLVAVYPASSSPKDILASKNAEYLRNWLYLDVCMFGEYSKQALELLKKIDAAPEFSVEDTEILRQGVCDYVAFSNYTSICVTTNEENVIKDDTKMKYGVNIPGIYKIVKNDFLGYTEFSQEVDPVGTRILLNQVYDRYRTPIFITQRGYGCGEKLDENGEILDKDRIRYLQLQIEQLKEAINDGVDLMGFCTWSIFDVMSTGSGVDKRYGMIFVDRDNDKLKTLKRIRKRSYFWYKELIESNGETV